MKWMKRLVVFVVGLGLVLGLVAAGAYYFGVRGTPDWIRRSISTPEEQAEAANRLDRKILETLSVIQEMNPDAATRTAASDDRRPAATQPAKFLEVSFHEDELNAAFQKWDKLYGWTERYKDYVQEPSVVLHEGHIILAGTSKELGTVVSLHFSPTLDAKGQLLLQMDRVLAGRLSLPQAFFEKYRTSARTKLQAVLPDFQKKAQFQPDGSANPDAMSAAMSKLFLHVLANEPAEPVLFLPVERNRSVPVTLTDVQIKDKSLTLKVKRMNASERATLLEEIRDPQNEETATNSKPSPAVAPKTRL
jgi:hypothetical protein